MLIRITCPNAKCKKQLRIDAKHAGKKISCTSCHQHIRLPTAAELKLPVESLTGPTGSQGGAEEAIMDFDALAAEAVSVEKSNVDVANKTEMIEFTCPQCDEQVKLAVENAGKRAPCPSCRRIITVPKVDTGRPKDWREREVQGPSLARKEEVKLEGAWGNEQVARVSLEALEEAKALPKVKRKLTVAEYFRYSIQAAIVLGILITGWWGWSRYRSAALESNTLASMDEAIKDPKQPPEMNAVLRRGLGEWKLLSGVSADVKKEGLAELRKAITSTGDQLWTWALAVDVAEIIGPLISLDSTQANAVVDVQFLVQLISSVKSGEPREEVLRTLSRSILKVAPPEKINVAKTLLTSVIKQAIPPGSISIPPEPNSTNKVPTSIVDYSEQLSSLGVLAQELIRHKGRDHAVQLVGSTADRGERAMYKKGMPVPKPFVAAMTALGLTDLEYHKDAEIDFELGKMTGHILGNQDGPANEIMRKRQEVLAEVNLLAFLDVAEFFIEANRLPEALSRLNEAMKIAEIYAVRREENWIRRVYAHVRLCVLTARAGEIALAEQRISKLKLDELPETASLARALIARQKNIQAGDGDSLLAGLTQGSAGQALAGFSLSKKQTMVTRSQDSELAASLPEGIIRTMSNLGGLLGFKLTHPE